jgi:hypothetical protein
VKQDIIIYYIKYICYCMQHLHHKYWCLGQYKIIISIPTLFIFNCFLIDYFIIRFTFDINWNKLMPVIYYFYYYVCLMLSFFFISYFFLANNENKYQIKIMYVNNQLKCPVLYIFLKVSEHYFILNDFFQSSLQIVPVLSSLNIFSLNQRV